MTTDVVRKAVDRFAPPETNSKVTVGVGPEQVFVALMRCVEGATFGYFAAPVSN